MGATCFMAAVPIMAQRQCSHALRFVLKIPMTFSSPSGVLIIALLPASEVRLSGAGLIRPDPQTGSKFGSCSSHLRVVLHNPGAPVEHGGCSVGIIWIFYLLRHISTVVIPPILW